jgi:pilus assembly protein CpaB
MNRQNRHLVVLVVAVATATIASVGVYRAVDRMPVREVPLAHQSVVVAARALPMGTPLTERDVKVVAWPASSPVAGAYSNVADVVNRPLLAAVLENEPLVPAKLASREAGSGLPSAIPRGMRAISIKVNDVIGVAGFIQPGSRVDLMVTMRRREDSVTRTVASNVQVMSAGTRQEQQKQPPPDAKTAALPATVVTLMVTPGDAERIALAQSEGQIMLVLRNPLDGETATTTGVQTAALLGQAEAAPAPVKTSGPRRPVVQQASSEAPPPPIKRKIETIKAAKRSEEEIR